jgi:predicted GIY-YIG superfamily endonuclease
MESIDIIALIEGNSIGFNGLTEDNGVSTITEKLVSKIQANFTSYEQKLFVASFYCYLTNRDKNAFVVNFDDVWTWCGFTRKHDAKKLLEKHFIENVDYATEKAATVNAVAAFEEEKNEKLASASAEASFEEEKNEKAALPIGRAAFEREKNLGGAGKNKEKILLTIKTFKKFCLKAGTKKSDEIHEYYIKLEEIIHESMQEGNKEIHEKLKTSEKLLQDISTKLEDVISQKEKTLIDNFSGKPVVYIGLAEPGIIKFGFSNDISVRVPQHKREIGPQFTLEYVIETIYNREVEQLIKNQFARIEKEFVVKGKKKKQTELIQLSSKITLENFYNSVLVIKNSVNNDFVVKLINELTETRLKYENSLLTIQSLETKLKEKEENSKKIEEEKDKIIIKKENEINKALNPDGIKIIARDIDTGDEKKYDSVEQLSKFLKMSASTVRKNYVNKPIHVKGFHIREENQPYWKKPENYNYIRNLDHGEDENEEIVNSRRVIIKSVEKSTGVVAYYNSIKETVKILNLCKEGDNLDTVTRKLGHVATGKIKTESKDKFLSMFTWSKLKTCGYMVDKYGKSTCIEEIKNKTQKNKTKLKNKTNTQNTENIN